MPRPENSQPRPETQHPLNGAEILPGVRIGELRASNAPATPARSGRWEHYGNVVSPVSTSDRPGLFTRLRRFASPVGVGGAVLATLAGCSFIVNNGSSETESPTPRTGSPIEINSDVTELMTNLDNRQKVTKWAGENLGGLDPYVAKQSSWVSRGVDDDGILTIVLKENPRGGTSRIDLGPISEITYFNGYIQIEPPTAVDEADGKRLFPQSQVGKIDQASQTGQEFIDMRGVELHILTPEFFNKYHITTQDELAEALNKFGWEKYLAIADQEQHDPKYKQPGVVTVPINVCDPDEYHDK